MASEPKAQETRTWRTGRAAAGVVGLVFAVFYLLEGRELPFGQMRAPGPGGFPLAVGIILALVSAAVIADALLTKRPGRASFPHGKDLKRLLAVTGAFIAYVLLLNIFGFPLATALVVICFTRLVGNVSWLIAAISGVGVTFTVWAVFTLILGVRLPTAIWS